MMHTCFDACCHILVVMSRQVLRYCTCTWCTTAPVTRTFCLTMPMWRRASRSSTIILWFSSWSLFESVYLVMHWSDANDKKRTMVLQTVLVMRIFSSLVPTHSDAHIIKPQTSSNGTHRLHRRVQLSVRNCRRYQRQRVRGRNR